MTYSTLAGSHAEIDMKAFLHYCIIICTNFKFTQFMHLWMAVDWPIFEQGMCYYGIYDFPWRSIIMIVNKSHLFQLITCSSAISQFYYILSTIIVRLNNCNRLII